MCCVLFIISYKCRVGSSEWGARSLSHIDICPIELLSGHARDIANVLLLMNRLEHAFNLLLVKLKLNSASVRRGMGEITVR